MRVLRTALLRYNHQIMFEPGRTYKRATLHEVWEGATRVQAQGGILTPKAVPLVILVTGSEGEAHGYDDYRDDDGTWHYFGAGQSGDMTMVRGNKAVRDHSVNGKELHLFQSVGGGLRYLGQFVCAEYEFRDGEPDSNDKPRTAIVFSLLPIESTQQPPSFDPELGSGRSRWELPVEELRAMAAAPATPQGHAPGARRNVYNRSEALRIYVQRRANGMCEGCGEPAPFVRKDGTPYLEPHHTTRLADGGPDHPDHVIALCPTCHRRVHSAADGDTYNNVLIERIPGLERTFAQTSGGTDSKSPANALV